MEFFKREEEVKYERAEFDQDKATGHVYMNHVMDHGPDVNIYTVAPEVQDNYTNNSCHLQAEFSATCKRFKEVDILGRPHNSFAAVYPNLNPVLKRTDTKDNPGPKKRARFDLEFKEENDPISHAVPQLLGKVNKAAEGPDYTSLIEHSDVVINIARFLSVWDVLSLGCCSKYLNALCESDGIWKELFERRWQAASEITESSKEVASTSCSNYKEWKAEYISNHRKMANMIPMALKPLIYTIGVNMLDGCNYFQAVDHLKRLKLKFEDVYFFLFKKELKVTINMVAMHYAFFCLGSPDLKMVLMSSGVAERKVCLRWSLKSLETSRMNVTARCILLGRLLTWVWLFSISSYIMEYMPMKHK